MIIAYADASLTPTYLGVGWVLKRAVGSDDPYVLEAGMRVMRRSELPFEYHTSMAEYRACISAVRAALEYDCEDEGLWLYNDNKGVVQRIKGRQRIHTSGYFHHALWSFLGRFADVRVKWLGRERNVAAHHMAKAAVAVLSETERNRRESPAAIHQVAVEQT